MNRTIDCSFSSWYNGSSPFVPLRAFFAQLCEKAMAQTCLGKHRDIQRNPLFEMGLKGVYGFANLFGFFERLCAIVIPQRGTENGRVAQRIKSPLVDAMPFVNHCVPYGQLRGAVIPQRYKEGHSGTRSESTGISPMMSWLSVVFFCFLSITCSHAQVSQLNDYLKIAEENNPGLKVKYNEYQAALERLPQAASLPDPQVSLGYFLQPVETRVGAQRATVGISQAFPWFGALKAQKNVEEARAKADYESYQDARLQVFYEVKDAYYRLYYLKKASKITEENLALLKSIKALSQVSFESGKAALVDVFRIEMDIKDLSNKLETIKDSQTAAVTIFERVLNTKLEGELHLPDTLWEETIPISKETIQNQMVANSHRLKALDKQYEAFGHQEEAAKKMGMPGFTVSANYISIGERTDMDVPGNGKDALLLPQVGIKIPLNRKKYKSMVKEAGFKQAAISAQIDNTTNHLITEMGKVYANYLEATRSVALNKSQADLAARSLDLLKTAFSTDGKNFEEVLRMNQKVLNYQLELEKARSVRNQQAAYINYLIAE